MRVPEYFEGGGGVFRVIGLSRFEFFNLVYSLAQKEFLVSALNFLQLGISLKKSGRSLKIREHLWVVSNFLWEDETL